MKTKRTPVGNYEYRERILCILAKKKKVRFKEFLEYKKLDINPKMLSKVLSILVKEGKVKRKRFIELPPRVEYSLI